MQEILIILPIFPLLLMTIEDLKEKAVSDEINYFMLAFSYIFTIVLLLLNKVNINSLALMGLILLSIFLFLFKTFAIGDFILMIWLAVYLSMLPASGIMLFYVFTFFYGFLISYIYSFVLFTKNKDKIDSKRRVLLLVGLILTTFGLSYYIYGISRGYLASFEGVAYLLVSLIIILIAVTIMKLLEKNVKSLLTFVRTPDQLIEGDWIEEPIIINGEIKEDIIKEARKYFDVETDNNSLKLYYKKLIVNIPGLTRGQIEFLKKLQKEGYDVKVTVYEGFPFIPAILFGYLTTIIFYFMGFLF